MPCDDGYDDADYTIAMSGDLDGCIYGYVLSEKVLDNGIYQSRDQEFFVGSWDGNEGSWEMREHFTSKWDPTFTEQKYGRCITGRLDFKDDVVLGVVNYRGHVKLGS